jgi:hypothetical protein
MPAHSVVRPRSFIAFLGIALGAGFGAALCTSPAAVADPDPSPIDVWPQDYFALEGEADGAPTNVESYLPDGWGTTEDQDFTSFIPGSGEYSAQLNLLDIPNVVDNTYQKVLDSSGDAPAVGSFSDSYQTLYGPLPSISGDVPYFTNNYIDLQGFGTGDETIITPLFFVNQYVSDSAGVEDVASIFGQSFTLFDIPAADASAGAATDLSSLLTELPTLF